MVVVHGVFDDGPCRAPLVADLAGEYDFVAVDARGHRRSDTPETGYDAGTRADDLAGLVGALGLEDPILFRHSMGGDTVAAAAPRYPDLPQAVVLKDPEAMLEHSEDDWEESIAGARDRLELWENHTKAELLEEDDELRGHVAAGRDELASRLADAHRRLRPEILAVFENDPLEAADTYPAIDAPTLVLRADAGRDASATGSWSMACRTVARPRPDAGHCVFRDSRERATGKLRSFLDDV